MAWDVGVWEASVRSCYCWGAAARRTMFLLLLVVTIIGSQQVQAQKQRQPGGGLVLVKCYCQGNEVRNLENGTCQEQPGGTKVITETGQMATSQLNVQVRIMECPVSHHEITLGQGDVHLRMRGDWVVLRGPWRGLRINHYCLIHTNNEVGFPTWRIRACVPPPIVPRCCPEGQTMRGDKCTNATIIPEDIYDPPLLAGPGELPRSFPGKTSELTPLGTCKTGSTLRQAMLGRQSERQASVISLPTGLVLVTKRGSARTEYTFAPDFCVDQAVVHQKEGGNSSYFAFYCDQVLASDLRCNDTNVCVRKCCGEGQAMHAHITTCVPTTQRFLAPFEETHPKEVHVLVGLPKCRPIGLVQLQRELDQRGRFTSHGRQYNSSEYCIENFIRGNTSAMEVLVCLESKEDQTGWAGVRLYVTPVFLAVSAACAVVLLILMWLLPELRRDGGQAQASHAVAIFVATMTLLILQIPSNFQKPACIFMAILLHYSFMSMFTWVAVMSLVLWMRVRTIAGTGGLPPMNQTLIQQSAGWGIPLIVVILNVIIHYAVPTDQTGVVHPRIAEGRCWYAGTLEVLLYFYIPILVFVITSAIMTGLSLWHYCTMSRESMSGLGDLEQTPNGNAPDVTGPNTFPSGPDTKEKQHSFNFTHEIVQHSVLLGFAIFFWITEGLSMGIKPVEIWALADIINSLYGLVALLVFILNPNKRRHLKLQDLTNSFVIRIKNIAKCMP